MVKNILYTTEALKIFITTMLRKKSGINILAEKIIKEVFGVHELYKIEGQKISKNGVLNSAIHKRFATPYDAVKYSNSLDLSRIKIYKQGVSEKPRKSDCLEYERTYTIDIFINRDGEKGYRFFKTFESDDGPVLGTKEQTKIIASKINKFFFSSERIYKNTSIPFAIVVLAQCSGLDDLRQSIRENAKIEGLLY